MSVENNFSAISEEEDPLTINSKIEYLNGLAVKNDELRFLILEKEEKQIESALKLQELIKKELPPCKKACDDSIKTQQQTEYYGGLSDGYEIVLRLVEESEK